MYAILLVFSTIFIASYQIQPWKPIYDRIMEEGEFVEFKKQILKSRKAIQTLFYSGVTLFVPTNQVLEGYDGFYMDDLISYHIGAKPYTLDELSSNNSLESVDSDNPPLWVTVVNDGYYINNAKIVERKSNYVSECKGNLNANQVLHVIDQVLDPMVLISFSNQSAYKFLQNHQYWKLDSRKVSNFLKKIQFHNKEELYKEPGGHTFFIPIDDKRHDHKFEDIDSYIIDAHVIPNVVLFTRPADKSFVYETAANGDFIYIVVSMLTVHGKDYIKSHTVLGNSEHRKGKILAEIVKGNIPVTNGVVHLISQPLAIFERELKPFPYLPVAYKIAADPDLNITYLLGKKGRINKILNKENRMYYTYFAPRNRAWNDYLGYNKDEILDILSRHLIVSDDRYTMSKLASSNHNSGTNVETLGGPLKINVVYTNNTFFVIWGQKWIKVLLPDYQCSDGVVHIVDDIFAAPKPPTTSPTTHSGAYTLRKRSKLFYSFLFFYCIHKTIL